MIILKRISKVTTQAKALHHFHIVGHVIMELACDYFEENSFPAYHHVFQLYHFIFAIKVTGQYIFFLPTVALTAKIITQ